MNEQLPLHLPRNPVLDTSADPKMVWKAYLYARDTGDVAEADRLLERWRSLQPRRPE